MAVTVRSNLPQRRAVPSRNPKGNNWSEHKSDLREDFHNHCGYCGSYDGFSHTYFEVDHFVPKSIFTINGNIGLCQYDNLVYSCKFCNNIKSKKWPSNDENLPNLNNKGFVDPTLAIYDTHIYRTESGSIRWLTDLGKWMVEVGFKFDERDFCVKLLWELNQLRISFLFLVDEAKKYDSNSKQHKIIIEKAKESAFHYTLYRNELDEYYKSL
ncbi:HNH endonuclease [Belliella aquatica]|uniref:HNH domain-containing protein n=1 Tax=Belliella aquatica TaxID=1323734 RepID=A0ABQ1M5F5_9BACT|nr:HNH endonuclease signature motif containing protein [Belliella aquatica]MCH7404702.1 HNH endonuclease [Belliella aquatica]GGC34745.1 hypothetical protein GCM10010993_12140 [Belliella aquatica]